MKCPFCEIIEKKKPARVFFEDETVIVFADIFPKAEIHLLVCPRIHYERLAELPENLLLRLLDTIKTIAAQLGLENNFRLVLNNGAAAGQIIEHIHFHFLSNAGGVKLKFKSSI
nr:HIT domain-containing protein [candidate division Zixibacteria bacterium]